MERAISTVATPDLIDQITELAGHLNAAQARWLALIAEFDRREAWAEWGVKSCAHWLNWKCGLDLGAAREKLRVAHALEQLPRITSAMAAGSLSYSKVRAMTRVADTVTEEYFLNVALHGTAHQVEKLVRAFRRAKESQELSREAQQQARRSLSWFHDEDGSLVIKARLPTESGAVFLKALQAAETALPPPDVSAETASEPIQSRAASRADALALMAEGFLASDQQAFRVVIASRSWCMWMPRPCGTVMPVAASWKKARALRLRPRVASHVMRASSYSLRTNRVSR